MTERIQNQEPLQILFSDLKRQDQTLDVNSIEKGIAAEAEGKLKKLLEAITVSFESKALAARLAPLRLSAPELSALLKNPHALKIADAMSKNENKYRFQLGIILPIIGRENIPPEFRNKLTRDESSLQILIPNQEWFLCETADGNMIDALEHNATVVVNEKLTVKVNGKMTGLCTQSFITETETIFLQGNFYSPLDPNTRHLIRTSFDEGIKHVSLNEGNWALMRQFWPTFKKSAPDILEKAQTYAKKKRGTLPEKIEGKTRSEWRTGKAEGY